MLLKPFKNLGNIKTLVEIIGCLIAIIIGILTISEIIERIERKKIRPSVAKLKIDEVLIYDKGSSFVLEIKLRNIGGQLANLTKAELEFKDALVKKMKSHYAKTLTEVRFDWSITSEDIRKGISSKRLKRIINADDADCIQFKMAFKESKSRLIATLKLIRIYYNDEMIERSISKKIVINNPSGTYFKPILPNDPNEVLFQLKKENIDTKCQIIEELAKHKQKYDATIPIIRDHLYNSNQEVRAAAAAYFNQIEYNEAICGLINAIKDSNSNAKVRDNATKALISYGKGYKCGFKKLISEIESLIENNNHEIKKLAKYILRNIRAHEDGSEENR